MIVICRFPFSLTPSSTAHFYLSAIKALPFAVHRHINLASTWHLLAICKKMLGGGGGGDACYAPVTPEFPNGIYAQNLQ